MAYPSVLTFDELGYRLILALIKDHYEGSPLELLRDQEEKLLAEFAPTVSSLLKRLRAYANLTVLDVLVSDLDVWQTPNGLPEMVLNFSKPRPSLDVKSGKIYHSPDVYK